MYLLQNQYSFPHNHTFAVKGKILLYFCLLVWPVLIGYGTGGLAMIDRGVARTMEYLPTSKCDSLNQAIGGSRVGDSGSGPPAAPPTKKYKNIGFLSNTGQDPLKITKLQSQRSMLGHHRHSSETPFKWRFAGVPMLAL